MAHLYFLLGLTALMLVVLALQIQRLLSRRIRFPYLAAETLLNPPQRALKTALEQTLGRDYRIYGRVRAAEVIQVQGHLTRLERQRAQARLDGLVFDCLICSLETTALAGAVNVTPTRGRWRERRAQRRLQQICTAARLPLLCFEERELTPVAALERQIMAALQTRWLDIKPSVAPSNAAEVRPRREPVLKPPPLEMTTWEPEFRFDPNLEIINNDDAQFHLIARR